MRLLNIIKRFALLAVLSAGAVFAAEQTFSLYNQTDNPNSYIYYVIFKNDDLPKIGILEQNKSIKFPIKTNDKIELFLSAPEFREASSRSFAQRSTLHAFHGQVIVPHGKDVHLVWDGDVLADKRSMSTEMKRGKLLPDEPSFLGFKKTGKAGFNVDNNIRISNIGEGGILVQRSHPICSKMPRDQEYYKRFWCVPAGG